MMSARQPMCDWLSQRGINGDTLRGEKPQVSRLNSQSCAVPAADSAADTGYPNLSAQTKMSNINHVVVNSVLAQARWNSPGTTLNLCAETLTGFFNAETWRGSPLIILSTATFHLSAETSGWGRDRSAVNSVAEMRRTLQHDGKKK